MLLQRTVQISFFSSISQHKHCARDRERKQRNKTTNNVSSIFTFLQFVLSSFHDMTCFKMNHAECQSYIYIFAITHFQLSNCFKPDHSTQ